MIETATSNFPYRRVVVTGGAGFLGRFVVDGLKRYQHVEPGINSRLDEVQAAILSIKLAHLDTNNAMRRSLAAAYIETIRGVKVPAIGDGHVFHLFVVEHHRRAEIVESLDARGVGTAVHYPTPVHMQQAYRHLGLREGSLPATEQCARQIFSLPMYVGLAPEDVHHVGRLVSAAAQDVDRTRP